MHFSLASTEADILKAIHEQITPDQFSRQLASFGAGIQSVTSLVFGHPQ